jgi:DNA-binding FadR family transcriptional regulator
MDDLDVFTRLSRDFHLAVAEAAHNRVLVVQLISLEHVSWPRRNATATPKLAEHILEIHTKLTDLIELRDAPAALPNAAKPTKTAKPAVSKREGERPWQNSSLSLISACRNGWPRKRTTSARKASNMNSAS